MRGKRGKCCRKEGLIEDDKKLDTESQLEKRGVGATGGGFRENLETEGGDEERKERRKKR